MPKEKRAKPAPTPPPSNIPPDLILDDAATTRALLSGISRATHYSGMKEGRYSRPVRVAPKKNAWVRARTLADIARIIDAGAQP